MKLKIFLLSMVLVTVFSINLFAASCGSCESHEKPAMSKVADASCPDGVCASTDDQGHDHKAKATEKEAKSEQPATLNTSGLKTLIDSGLPLTIVDARAEKWDDGKRLPGALSLHAGSKLEDIEKVLPKKDALIITYCANLKCPASHELNKVLKANGYTNLIEYPEGIQGWIEAGNPVK